MVIADSASELMTSLLLRKAQLRVPIPPVIGVKGQRPCANPFTNARGIVFTGEFSALFPSMNSTLSLQIFVLSQFSDIPYSVTECHADTTLTSELENSEVSLDCVDETEDVQVS